MNKNYCCCCQTPILTLNLNKIQITRPAIDNPPSKLIKHVFKQCSYHQNNTLALSIQNPCKLYKLEQPKVTYKPFYKHSQFEFVVVKKNGWYLIQITMTEKSTKENSPPSMLHPPLAHKNNASVKNLNTHY